MLRDYLDDVALPGWAEAQLLGHPDAGVHREHATVMGEALVRTTTDVMVRDTARALAEPVSATSRDPLRSQAQGFAAYFEAKRNHEQQLPSCPQFQEAYRALESGGSPYAAWPRLFFIYCSFAENTDAVADGLESLRLIAEQRGYVQLLGRVQWLEGLSDAFRASLTASMERYRLARASFQTTQDVQSETVILGLLAEDELVLGERRGAWRDRLSSLARLDQVRSATWRYTLLTAAARACVEEERPRSARHFASALVEAAVKSFGPVLASESLVRRADIHHAIGSGDLALADLGAARRWIDQIADKVRADRRSAEVDATEGKVLADSRPAEAAPLIERALKYFASTAPARVPPLRLLSARALIGVGRNDDAEKDLAAGIEALERQSASVKDAAQQITFFDQALPLFDDMVRLQVTRHHDPERGLAFTERSRARQLGRSLGGSGFAPFDPESLREILPEGLALVYYMPLSDRLFEWALTRGGTHFVERPVTRAKLSQMVAAHRAAIERRAPADVLRQPAGRLHDELVRPLLPFLGAQRVLVFVPDAMLQSLAFSSLWDRKLGRYLVEDYLLAVAPSGSVFVQASKGAIALGPSPRAFVIGNPLVDRGVGAAFPNLPGAEAEAVEIAGLYPSVTLLVGKEATKAQFLRGVAGSQVVHYAGHASSSELNPLAARLLLARDQGNGDSGSLLLRDLDRQSFVRTRLVVLAACRTAAGAASGVEGALSLARPFLAAGVPAVVATLWEIDDAVSRRLLVDFHRALLEGQDPADALRSAQTALIRSSDPSFSHPVNWAAFTYLGGLDFHSLPKGVIS
jgi:CHAT domain-containing protein